MWGRPQHSAHPARSVLVAYQLGGLMEFARLPEDELDIDAVLTGHGETAPLDAVALSIHRLDAAVMLSMVFNSEAPDEEAGVATVDRLHELRERLLWEWDRWPGMRRPSCRTTATPLTEENDRSVHSNLIPRLGRRC